MIVDVKQADALRRHIRLASLWHAAHEANQNARNATNSDEKAKFYVLKANSVSQIILEGGAIVGLDGSMLSIADRDSNRKLHLPWDHLSQKVQDLIMQELGEQ